MPGRRPGGASLGALFLTFLKIGAVLYGSGYVLIAFLVGYLVAGGTGAILATVAIFLGLSHPLVPRIRGSRGGGRPLGPPGGGQMT